MVRVIRFQSLLKLMDTVNVQDPTGGVVVADTEIVVLERDADEIGNRVLGFFGQSCLGLACRLGSVSGDRANPRKIVTKSQQDR